MTHNKTIAILHKYRNRTLLYGACWIVTIWRVDDKDNIRIYEKIRAWEYFAQKLFKTLS